MITKSISVKMVRSIYFFFVLILEWIRVEEKIIKGENVSCWIEGYEDVKEAEKDN